MEENAVRQIPQDLLPYILDFLIAGEHQAIPAASQVCKAWQSFFNTKINHWENLLTLQPFKKTAKQTFYQKPLHRSFQFFSNDTQYNMNQNWKKFISELSGECEASAKNTIYSDKEILFGSIEFFLKKHWFKQELIHLLSTPDTILWKRLSFCDIIDEDLLMFFVEYHPTSIPFLLLTKQPVILTHLNEAFLEDVIKHAPKYIPLILENPSAAILDKVDSYLNSIAQTALNTYIQTTKDSMRLIYI